MKLNTTYIHVVGLTKVFVSIKLKKYVLLVDAENKNMSIIHMSADNNNQTLFNSINSTEINDILKNQKIYNIVIISLCMSSHLINILSIAFSFVSTIINR